jgi:hypothetical protein
LFESIPNDREIFAVATKVSTGDEKRALFWEASWIDGLRPKDVAPLVSDISKKRKMLVRIALEDDLWISQINIHNGLSMEHIVQFMKL